MTYGRLAQLVEHLLDVQEVTGSSPVPSTIQFTSPRPLVWGLFSWWAWRPPIQDSRTGNYKHFSPDTGVYERTQKTKISQKQGVSTMRVVSCLLREW